MVELRRAAADDADAIAAVHVASSQVAYRGLLPDAVLDGLSVAARARNRELVGGVALTERRLRWAVR